MAYVPSRSRATAKRLEMVRCRSLGGGVSVCCVCNSQSTAKQLFDTTRLVVVVVVVVLMVTVVLVVVLVWKCPQRKKVVQN